MDRLTTPDDRFLDLPDFPFAPHYADVADPTGGPPLSMAYLDEGPRDGRVVVLLHGEPTWSYLYRTMIPALTAHGLRAVAPDLIGFGRSDKPSRRTDHSYARHVAWTAELLIDRLQLSDITLFAQDWGSLIGLRLVGENPERFAKIAIGNGFLPTGDERTNDAFRAWQDFSQSTPEFKVGNIVKGGCVQPMDPSVVHAYDAPFPDDSYKEGPRVFPTLVPTTPDDPAHDANVAAWRVLSAWTKPFLTCFSDGDPITRGADRKLISLIPGTKDQPHQVIEGAGHFLQEDQGPALGALVATFATS